MSSKVTELSKSMAKPCPFCGCHYILMKEGKTTIIECGKCGVLLFNYIDGVKRDVIAAWNKRQKA